MKLIDVLEMVFFIIILGISSSALMANLWYTDEGVLKKLQSENSDVEKVLTVSKNTWDYSEIRVLKGEVWTTYYLDTNILRTIKLKRKKTKDRSICPQKRLPA